MGTANVYATYDPTSLFAGAFPTRHRPITLASGSNTTGTPLKRGALLGRTSIGAAASAVKASGANTGNGTLALDGATPLLANAQAGVYAVRFTAATTFRVTDPRGNVLGDGANGAAFADQVKFTTTAGGAAFVAGDGFDITVAAADKYVPCVKTAFDGSQTPIAILAADTDAGAADVATTAYFEGEFAGEIMTIDASWTIATLQTALRQANAPLYVRSVGILG